MNKKKLFKYCTILWVSIFLSTLLHHLLDTNLFSYIIDLAIGFILFDIWRSINNKRLRKYYLVFITVFGIQWIFMILITLWADFINIRLENTWVTLVMVNCLIVSLIVYFFKLAKALQVDNGIVAMCIYFLCFMVSLSMLIINIHLYSSGAILPLRG